MMSSSEEVVMLVANTRSARLSLTVVTWRQPEESRRYVAAPGLALTAFSFV